MVSAEDLATGMRIAQMAGLSLGHSSRTFSSSAHFKSAM
jgi:hypothetical protein